MFVLFSVLLVALQIVFALSWTDEIRTRAKNPLPTSSDKEQLKSTEQLIVLMALAFLVMRLENLNIVRWDWGGSQTRRGGADLCNLLSHCKLTCFAKIHSKFSWLSVQGNDALQFRRTQKLKQWPLVWIAKTKQREGKILNVQDKLLLFVKYCVTVPFKQTFYNSEFTL